MISSVGVEYPEWVLNNTHSAQIPENKHASRNSCNYIGPSGCCKNEVFGKSVGLPSAPIYLRLSLAKINNATRGLATPSYTKTVGHSCLFWNEPSWFCILPLYDFRGHYTLHFLPQMTGLGGKKWKMTREAQAGICLYPSKLNDDWLKEAQMNSTRVRELGAIWNFQIHLVTSWERVGFTGDR